MVGKAGVQLVCRLLLVGGALPGVLDRKSCGNDKHLVEAAQPRRLQHHPPEPRVKRQLRQLAPDGREPPGACATPAGEPTNHRPATPAEPRPPTTAPTPPSPSPPPAPSPQAWSREDKRAELFQQSNAVFDVAPVRWVDKWEVADITKADRCHLQQDRRQVRAQDLRFGEGVPSSKVLL